VHCRLPRRSRHRERPALRLGRNPQALLRADPDGPRVRTGWEGSSPPSPVGDPGRSPGFAQAITQSRRGQRHGAGGLRLDRRRVDSCRSRRLASRYRPAMAATKRTAAKQTAAAKRAHDEDVIARLADRGEETVRWFVDIPRRIVGDLRGGVDARLHDAAGRLRALDPLDGRVTEIERRLASLEKPARKITRRTSTRAKPAATSRAGTAPAADTAGAPATGEHDASR
jgi:hypothetical protein